MSSGAPAATVQPTKLCAVCCQKHNAVQHCVELHSAALPFTYHSLPPAESTRVTAALPLNPQNVSTKANTHNVQLSTTADTLDSSLSSAVAAAAEHLVAHGWAVVPGVLSKEVCQQYEQGVWDWLGRLGDGIRCACT
jgi:hypothetical protein